MCLLFQMIQKVEKADCAQALGIPWGKSFKAKLHLCSRDAQKQKWAPMVNHCSTPSWLRTCFP